MATRTATPTVVDSDGRTTDELDQFEAGHRLLAIFLAVAAAVSAFAMTWLASQVELRGIWLGSALFGSAFAFIWAYHEFDHRRTRRVLFFVVLLSYTAFAHFYGGEDGRDIASQLVLLIAAGCVGFIWDKLKQSIWGDSRASESTTESEEDSRGDRILYFIFAASVAIGFTAFLFEDSSYYRQKSELEPVLISWVRRFANPYLVELLTIFLLGSGVVAVLWKVPIPKGNRAVFVPPILLMLSCFWNARAWVRADQPHWLVPAHVLACVLPIVGISTILLLLGRPLSRPVFGFAGFWLYLWLFGPAFPAW